jgi:hypothetical protein
VLAEGIFSSDLLEIFMEPGKEHKYNVVISGWPNIQLIQRNIRIFQIFGTITGEELE